MHEDDVLAFFTLHNNAISRLEVLTKNRKLLPVSIYLVRDNQEQNLIDWIRNRCLSSMRCSSEINRVSQLVKNYGLSLSDHYWIKPVDSEIEWDDVNLYTNKFNFEKTLDLKFYKDEEEIDDSENLSADYSLGGVLPKKWIINENNDRMLIKGNTSLNNSLDTLSEYFASIIHQRQNKFDYSDYNFIDLSYKNTLISGCMCENFTDIDTELVMGSELLTVHTSDSKDNIYERYIELYKRFFGLDLREFFDYQIAVDFITTNIDRSFDNFGILRDSHSLRSIGYAPIYDSGSSLGVGLKAIPTRSNILSIKTNSFFDTEVELLKQVRNKGLVNIDLLPSNNELFEILSMDDGLTEDKIYEIVNLYSNKVSYFSEFQNGRRLWGI